MTAIFEWPIPFFTVVFTEFLNTSYLNEISADVLSSTVTWFRCIFNPSKIPCLLDTYITSINVSKHDLQQFKTPSPSHHPKDGWFPVTPLTLIDDVDPSVIITIITSVKCYKFS